MNVAKLALSVCLSVFVLACGESTTNDAGTPSDSAGGKADGVGGCEDIEADFLQCSENSVAGTCTTYVLETYPDAGSCCVSDVQPYAMCPAYGEAESCEAVNEEYLGCNAATDSATCNTIVRDGYPDAGSCCGRDFEDYELCAAYVTAETCDEVAADYNACNENDGEADCDQYVRDTYPSATGCCDLGGYDEICGLFVPEDSGSCAAIAEDYQACNENGGEADCDAYLQENYPWGVNCCFLDAFPDVCEAYSGGVSCDDVNSDYLACVEAADEEMCGIIATDTYPDAGEACCSGGADYEVCEVYSAPITCDDINEEYLLCLSVEDEAMCDIIIVDSYPDGGACCGHDFEDYQVCGAYG